jgi:hypothetical protein
MNTEGRGQFSAAPTALGYIYQCRYALLEALRRLPTGDSFCIGIETLDDVVFEEEGGAVDLLQTKHHIKGSASLTDNSPDIWKSLRIWINGQTKGDIPVDSRLFLITTAQVREGTAAHYLCPATKNVDRALERLNATATTSTNQTNNPGYSAFRSLDASSKRRLIEAISVLDSSPQVDDINDQLRSVVFYAVDRRFLDLYIQRLEGWWFTRVIKHLIAKHVTPILSEELEAEESRLRAQFKEDNLPIDDEIMEASVDASGYQNHIFVHQLKLIRIGHGRIVYAIKNYFRAFEQRSRWVREDLLYVGELDRYEERLIEEWDLLFEQMRDELGEEAAEEAKRQAAQNLYKWVETGAHHRIRPGVTEPAIARGTYQMLADDKRVGWHIEFRKRLEEILEKAEASI